MTIGPPARTTHQQDTTLPEANDLHMRIARFLVLLSMTTTSLLAPPASGAGEKRCSPAHVRKLVKQFIDSHNAGEFGKLDRLFAKGAEFHFYRMFPERPWPISDRRDDLISYFRQRHEHNDRFTLVELDLDKQRAGTPRMWGFRFTIERSSDDVAPWANGTFTGKGGAECTIAAWNGSWLP